MNFHNYANFLDEKVDNNVSKTMLNNIPPPEELPSIETSTSDGPISIQIISSDNSIEHEDTTKLPTVSKVHIKLDEERRSSSEDEMTVNIYNVTKSVVTLEKSREVKEVKREESEVIFEKVKKRQVTPEAVEVLENVKVEQNEVQAKPETPVAAVKTSIERVEVSIESKVTEVSKVAAEPQQAFIEQPQKPQRVLPEPVAAPSPITPTQDTQIAVVKSSNVIESPAEVTVTEVPIEKIQKVEDDQRPTSPLWTYTLPAPPVFADSSTLVASPTHHQKNGDKFFSDFASTCNETVLSDSNTTVISAETHIQPIIVQRKSLDDSFNMKSPIADDDSVKSAEVITSDLEDGYLGNGKIVNVVESPNFKKEIVIEDFKRSRVIITRSDSFHSIGGNFVKRGPLSPQRSTSFLSLVQAQKAERIAERNDSAPYSRQKSNSELSISDTPSLQSLEVIKNILNSSRKNSLQDVMEAPPPPPPEIKKFEETVVKRQVSEPIVESKPAETQWRYSGPPKINLGTWSERPKVEVAIAADRDYKFGKVAARDFKNDAPVTTSKRHTIHISNDRVEAEKHLPKVLGVEYKKDVSPAAEIVNKPTRTIINIKPRPMSMDVGSSYSQVVTSPTLPSAVTYNRAPQPFNQTSQSSVTYNKPAPASVTYNQTSVTYNGPSPTSPPAPSAVSYNRLNTNAKKFTPVVRGFKLNNIKESADQPEPASQPTVEKKTFIPPSVPAKPAFLRSTSAGDINRNMKFTTAETKVDEDSPDFPFSQTILRKTGLKDKILLSDKDTKSMFGRVVDSHEPTVVRHHQNNVENHVAVRQMSMPVPPKPPTAPPPMNFRKSAPVELDSRNQLLDAIKNFNRDQLRHK